MAQTPAVQNVRRFQSTQSIPFPEPCAEGKDPFVHSIQSNDYSSSIQVDIDPDSLDEWVTPTPVPPESFAAVKNSGGIKMTDYSRGRKEVSNFLSSIGKARDFVFHYPAVKCDSGETRQGIPRGGWTTYDLVSPASSLLKRKGLSTYRGYGSPSWDSQLEQVKSACVADSLTTIDVLTTMAEARESLTLIVGALRAVRHPLMAFKELRDAAYTRRNPKTGAIELDDKKMLAAAWLKYRYAIMPNIFTIQDAVQLFEEKRNVYKTTRKSDQVTFSSSGKLKAIASGDTEYLYEDYNVSIGLRATGKAKFSSSSLRLTDQVQANPFLTAWELIPYSFVVDWFLNVGDWVSSQTSSLVDIAEQRVFCSSVRFKGTSRLYHYADTQVEETRTYSNDKYGRVGTFRFTEGAIHENLIRVTTEDWYERLTFKPSDVRLTLSSNLNWKRWMDAYSLSLTPARRALRQLR